jgi:hypothetical protein
MGAAPELSTNFTLTFTLTFALTLLSCSACGSDARRPHTDRANLRRGGTCARRSRAGVEASDIRVLIERAGLDQRRPSTRLRAPRATSRGGARPGRGVGTSVGRCRWRRMRLITEASSISAISRKRPPSFDRAQDGPEHRRRARHPQRSIARNSCSTNRGSLPRRWLEPTRTEETSKRVASQALVAGQHSRDVTITSSRA